MIRTERLPEMARQSSFMLTFRVKLIRRSTSPQSIYLHALHALHGDSFRGIQVFRSLRLGKKSLARCAALLRKA